MLDLCRLGAVRGTVWHRTPQQLKGCSFKLSLGLQRVRDFARSLVLWHTHPTIHQFATSPSWEVPDDKIVSVVNESEELYDQNWDLFFILNWDRSTRVQRGKPGLRL